jgi:hypothetical protein
MKTLRSMKDDSPDDEIQTAKICKKKEDDE